MAKTTTDENEPKKQQAKCSGCNHSESFHARGFCMVMGCTCKKWNGPKVLTRKEREEMEAKKAAQKAARQKR